VRKLGKYNELDKKKLVSILPDKPWKMPMYWHHWAIESEVYKKFNTLVIEMAKKKFNNL